MCVLIYTLIRKANVRHYLCIFSSKLPWKLSTLYRPVCFLITMENDILEILEGLPLDSWETWGNQVNGPCLNVFARTQGTVRTGPFSQASGRWLCLLLPCSQRHWAHGDQEAAGQQYCPHRHCCRSHALRETNSLRSTMQMVGCSLLHRRPKAECPLSQGPWPVFLKTLYTLSVCAKPTSPHSLKLVWTKENKDTIKA